VAWFARLRLAGVRRACAEMHLDPPVLATVGLDEASGPAAAGTWQEAGVTGVCAYNDEYAFVVLAGLRGHKLRVPEDMAVIGVDNIPLAAFSDPPLTTVEGSMETHTEQLVASVLGALAGREPPPSLLREGVRLILRGSA
jgi:DNA-binding LacI/PurR family transcriptional regulator